MSRFAHHEFATENGWRFKLCLGRSTYSVEATKDGKLVERAPARGRSWGCSGTDALMMAAYIGDPTRAEGFIHYLFGPGELRDAWERSAYIGTPEKAQRDAA